MATSISLCAGISSRSISKRMGLIMYPAVHPENGLFYPCQPQFLPHNSFGLLLPPLPASVKVVGEEHLCRLDAQSEQEYIAYSSRAGFFDATARGPTRDAVNRIFREKWQRVAAPGSPWQLLTAGL